MNLLGKLSREHIINNNGRYINGFKKCNLKSKDFFKIDSHPNRSGYQKILHFITKELEKIIKLWKVQIIF